MQLTANHTMPLDALGKRIARGLSRIGTVLVNICEHQSRVRRVEALTAMSDDQLARVGLRREDIVRHVFRDVLHV